jgi:hypothetical protein
MIRTIRVLQVLCVGALAVAARPAAAGIEPVPFLDFRYVPDGVSAANFEVPLPTTPVVPVEILTLALTGVDPAVDVVLAAIVGGPAGAPAGSAAIVDFLLAGGTAPADGSSVDFNLLVDFAPFMGSAPVSGVQPEPFLTDAVSGVEPTPFLPGPLSAFNAMFDVLIDGGVVHHTMLFEAAPGFMFSDVAIDSGSVLLAATLTGSYESGGPDLFHVTITGSAAPVPEPTMVVIYVGLGLTGYGPIKWRGIRRSHAPRRQEFLA